MPFIFNPLAKKGIDAVGEGGAGGAVSSVDGLTGDVDLSDSYEPKNANIQSHVSNTSNPHSVTKSQVGLGNVPNLDTTNAVNNTHAPGSDDQDLSGYVPFVLPKEQTAQIVVQDSETPNTDGGSIMLGAGAATDGNAGGQFVASGGRGGETGDGGAASFQGGAGGNTTGKGGDIEFIGGDANGEGNGGDVKFYPGMVNGSGSPGRHRFFNSSQIIAVILDAENLTEDRVISFPDKTGTLATTDDIPSSSSFVPYTGATEPLEMGMQPIRTQQVEIPEDGEIAIGSAAFSSTTAVKLSNRGNGKLGIQSIGGFSGVLDVEDLTEERTVKLPDVNGILVTQAQVLARGLGC